MTEILNTHSGESGKRLLGTDNGVGRKLMIDVFRTMLYRYLLYHPYCHRTDVPPSWCYRTIHHLTHARTIENVHHLTRVYPVPWIRRTGSTELNPGFFRFVITDASLSLSLSLSLCVCVCVLLLGIFLLIHIDNPYLSSSGNNFLSMPPFQHASLFTPDGVRS